MAWTVGASCAVGGTISVPGDFTTIQAALNAAGPGDTVRVETGVYNERLAFPSSGSGPDAYITLEAASGHTPVLDGTSVPGQDMILIASRSYVRVIGFEIRNNLGVRDGSGIRVTGAGSYIEIRNNRIHDMRGRSAMGITVYGTEPEPISHLIIDGNEIYDCEPAPSEALVLNGNVTNFVVTNNIVRDVNNIGIDFISGETDIQPDPAKGVRCGVCRGNQVYRARSSYGGGFAAGIYVDGARDLVIENNVVSGSDLGIEIGAENAGIIASGIVVRNNIIHRNEKAGLVFGGYAASAGRTKNSFFLNNTLYKNDSLRAGFGEVWIQYADDNVVRSNLIYANNQNLLLLGEAGGSNNALDYNLWFADAGAGAARFVWQGTTYTGFSAYRSASGQDARSQFANPLLVAPSATDFHLSALSPAVNSGDPSFVPNAVDPPCVREMVMPESDIDAAPRVKKGVVDAGADELSCGDIVLDPGELCEDGNLIDCDGCDSNCTPSNTCGNRIICEPEQCDDGNTSDGHCCSAMCEFELLGTPCDDGNRCTHSDQCNGTGLCIGSATPRNGCRTPVLPGGSNMILKNNENDTSDVLVWRWRNDGSSTVGEFGNPTTSTGYALCAFDFISGAPALVLSAEVPPGGKCRGNDCWQSTGDTGFRYRDPARSAGGVQAMRLKVGSNGAASLIVRGRGPRLDMPILPLIQDPSVVVQLSNDAGICWEANYPAPATSDERVFKDSAE